MKNIAVIGIAVVLAVPMISHAAITSVDEVAIDADTNIVVRIISAG